VLVGNIVIHSYALLSRGQTFLDGAVIEVVLPDLQVSLRVLPLFGLLLSHPLLLDLRLNGNLLCVACDRRFSINKEIC